MKLTDIVAAPYIAIGLDAKSKTDVIDKLITLVAGHPSITDKTKLRSDVHKREKEMTTGIGKRVALPHAKTNAVSAPVLAFATMKKEIDFASIDNEPVDLVFLLATPENMLTQHLKLLSRISRLVSTDEMRQKLVAAKNADEILTLFLEEEKSYPEI
jgi:fructose PTS system EIIA component